MEEGRKEREREEVGKRRKRRDFLIALDVSVRSFAVAAAGSNAPAPVWIPVVRS